MPVVLRIGVENPEELLNTGAYGSGALIHLQSATAYGGSYADLTGTGSTPTLAIVAGTYAYSGYDPNGAASTWYRSRYKNAAGTVVSSWTDEFQVGTGGYCSLYDVKQDLDKPPSDTTADEMLLDYIADITDYIRGYTGREFLDATLTYTFDGHSAVHGGRCLPVPRGVRSLSLLETAASTGASFSTVSATDYFLRPYVQERTPGWPATEVWLSDVASSLSRFPSGYANVRLTGTFGFAAVPPRVEGVARRTVVRAYASRQAGQGDLVGSGGESGNPVISNFLSRRDREVLDAFRHAIVG